MPNSSGKQGRGGSQRSDNSSQQRHQSDQQRQQSDQQRQQSDQQRQQGGHAESGGHSRQQGGDRQERQQRSAQQEQYSPTAEKLQGKWQQQVGAAKHMWGKLTDDEILKTEGQMDKLSGLVKERYAISQEEAHAQVKKFLADSGS